MEINSDRCHTFYKGQDKNGPLETLDTFHVYQDTQDEQAPPVYRSHPLGVLYLFFKNTLHIYFRMCVDLMLLSLMSTSEICSFHDLRSYATFPKNIFKNPNIRDTILLHPILSLEKKHEEYYQVCFRFSMCGLRSGCESFLCITEEGCV